MRSYVVKRRLHFKHSRRRRMVSPPRPSRESITLSSKFAPHFFCMRQFAHLPQRKSFLNQERHTRETASGEANQPENDRGGGRRLRFYPKYLRKQTRRRPLLSAPHR